MQNTAPKKRITFFRHILFGIFFAVSFSAAFQSALQTLLQNYFNGPVSSINITGGSGAINVSVRSDLDLKEDKKNDKTATSGTLNKAGTNEIMLTGDGKNKDGSVKDDFVKADSDGALINAGNKSGGIESPKRGTITIGASLSGVIKIALFIWFVMRLKPVYNFAVKGDLSSRLKAIERFNGIYITIAMYFVILLLIDNAKDALFLYKSGSFSAFNFFTFYFIPSAFGCYYGIYFTIIYLEPFLFTKIADLFYSGEELYTKKDGLQLSLRSRLFMTILNLLVIPMIIIVCYSFLIPDISPEKLNAMTDLNEIKKIIYTILISKYNLLAIAFISLCYAIGYIEMLYRSIQRPIDELVKKMERLAAGDFDVKTSVLSSDEIGRLKYNFNVMIDGLTDREKLRETFGKYVSIEIAKHLIETNKINLGGEDIHATILFSDIRNFTSMSEKMSAGEVVDFLNEYFSYISDPIIQNHGVINKFIGDAVMAIYTPHLGSENHISDAVKSAAGMREKLKEFNASKKYNFEVCFGVGIHTGSLVAGNIGTKSRLEYTVIGDTVNVASRIESENKNFKTDILISENVFAGLDEELKQELKFEKCPPISVKGKEKPVMLYKIL